VTRLALRGVGRVYGMGGARHVALHDVDLEIASGEMLALTGPSGSGKSTLLQILGCLDRPTTGQYLFGDVEVGGLDRAAQARFRNRYLGFVFQAFHLLDDATAVENVELPLIYAGTTAGERRRKAELALAKVGLGSLGHRRPLELSGGQRQRVAIARALVTEPPVVLADEPTGNLDSQSTAEVLGLLRDIHRAGKTVVLVTHDETVARMATRRIEVRDGGIFEWSQQRPQEAR
jgi:putative ABC transport system ATP-binding protein